MKGYDSISVHIFDIFADKKKHVSRSEGERRPHLWNSKYLRVPGLLLIWSFVTENKKKLLIFTLSIIDFVFQIFNQGLLGLPTDMLGLWSRTRTQKAAFIIRFYKVKDHVNLTPQLHSSASSTTGSDQQMANLIQMHRARWCTWIRGDDLLFDFLAGTSETSHPKQSAGASVLE